MTKPFRPLPLRTLTEWVFGDLDRDDTILGIPVSNLEVPGPRLAGTLHGHALAAPLGVSAGPHTQLAQNIVAAWLCGARFMELKTVQVLDRITVARPCIDAADETYNCEWSQELTLEESFQEYLHAWVLIHALAHRIGLPDPGTVFAMSVGYDFEGVQSAGVQAFLAAMRDAAAPVEAAVAEVATVYPAVRDVVVPTELSDLVTLSTMHGCPPSEIERIARHLLQDLGLHTWVKLNPTLLGAERVRELLNEVFGYREITVPDSAFAHDPAFPEAMDMVRRLTDAAPGQSAQVGLKLSNTLEVVNHRQVFPAEESMMYLSGRSLHPVTLTLAREVDRALGGTVPLSFSGGADADNVAELVADGLGPVTVCTDLLKPGGYARLQQYLRNLDRAVLSAGAGTLTEYVAGPSGGPGSSERLAQHADRIVTDRRYRKRARELRFKGTRPLDRFDCIAAPCLEDCPTHQNVPDYLWAVAHGKDTMALEIIERTNPVPGVTGRVCDHPCTDRCVRTLYDAPLAIRDLKRFAADHGRPAHPVRAGGPHEASHTPIARVAVVGGGPAGISVATHLARLGFEIAIFEARDGLGGMTHGFLPSYRMAPSVLEADVQHLRDLGVAVHLGVELGRDVTLPFLRKAYDHVFLGVGAQRSRRLGVPGEDLGGVLEALDFLNSPPASTALGSRILVVGGGNTAMDAARSARRAAPQADVALVYRRTRAEMPADPDEIRLVEEEGVRILELLAPVRVEGADGRASALVCQPMRLGGPDRGGRPAPEATADPERRLDADTLIVAVGQELALDLFEASEAPATTPRGAVAVDPASGMTSLPGVYAGGDATRGPATVVEALGDGWRAAAAIAAEHGLQPPTEPHLDKATRPVDLLARKARTVRPLTVPELPVPARSGSDEVLLGFDEPSARAEAARCLDCDELCSLCVTVCPNRAHQAYRVPAEATPLPVLEVTEAGVVQTGTGHRAPRQATQTLVLADACNDCGNCVPFCPTAGSPFEDKPRVWLDAEGFAQDGHDAFRFAHLPEGPVLDARLAGRAYRLQWGLHEAVYAAPEVEIRLDLDTGTVLAAVLRASLPEGRVLDLTPLATMMTLRHAVDSVGALAGSGVIP